MRGGEQQYPPATNPKSTKGTVEERQTAKEQPTTFVAPPPYTPTADPPPPAASPPQMPQPQNYGGLPPPIGVTPHLNPTHRGRAHSLEVVQDPLRLNLYQGVIRIIKGLPPIHRLLGCLLYTSDAADE